MKDVIQLPLRDARGEVWIEAADGAAAGGMELASPDPDVRRIKALKSVADAARELGPVVQEIIEGLAAVTPNELTLEFGIVASAEMGFVVTKGTVGSNFKVTFKWQRGPDAAGDEEPDA